MNANELADLLTETAKFVDNITDNYQAVKDIKEAATMLRQQQAEIEHLKGLNALLKMQVNGLRKANEK